jgi:hypothetical protein
MPKSIPTIFAAAALLFSGLAVTPVALAKPAPNCVQTTITRVTTYFENDPSSGSVIIFASNLGVSTFKNERATIVDRNASAGAVIKRVRAGDSVKLCLTRVPTADKYCNPSKDTRGRVYSAYDNRLRASFSGSNADHDCGGA